MVNKSVTLRKISLVRHNLSRLKDKEDCSLEFLKNDLDAEIEGKMIFNSIKDILLPLFEKYKDNLVFAYLFGSADQNNLSQLSDIDIAVFNFKRMDESYFEILVSECFVL